MSADISRRARHPPGLRLRHSRSRSVQKPDRRRDQAPVYERLDFTREISKESGDATVGQDSPRSISIAKESANGPSTPPSVGCCVFLSAYSFPAHNVIK
jgi:hypothetical protein